MFRADVDVGDVDEFHDRDPVCFSPLHKPASYQHGDSAGYPRLPEFEALKDYRKVDFPDRLTFDEYQFCVDGER